MLKFELIHVDTCLSDYWCGHHLMHVSIYAYPMNKQQLINALKSEVNQGAFGGNAYDWKTRESEEFFNACNAAIDNIEVTTPIVFADIEQSEDEDSVMAYFIFDPLDE